MPASVSSSRLLRHLSYLKYGWSCCCGVVWNFGCSAFKLRRGCDPLGEPHPMSFRLRECRISMSTHWHASDRVGSSSPGLTKRALMRLVHGSATNDGAQHLRLQDFRGRNRSQIAVQHNEIGQHANGERSFLFLGKLCVGRTRRVRGNRLLDSELLLGKIRLRSRFVFPGHGSIESAEWIDGLDRIVRAKCQPHAGIEKLLPGIRSFRAMLADALDYPVHVG